MAKHRLEDSFRLYAAILEEAKVRLDAVQRVAVAPLSDTNPLAEEFCYLQFRMVCELIGLGCLVAHGDISAQQRHLQKLYAAGQIVTEMSSLNPDFYPRPGIMRRTPFGQADHSFDFLGEGFLTREDLRALDQRCGATLHRGNLKKLLKSSALPTPDFSEITEWHRKIENLLASHVITVAQGQSVAFALLRNPSDNNRVHVGIADAN